METIGLKHVESKEHHKAKLPQIKDMSLCGLESVVPKTQTWYSISLSSNMPMKNKHILACFGVKMDTETIRNCGSHEMMGVYLATAPTHCLRCCVFCRMQPQPCKVRGLSWTLPGLFDIQKKQFQCVR